MPLSTAAAVDEARQFVAARSPKCAFQRSDQFQQPIRIGFRTGQVPDTRRRKQAMNQGSQFAGCFQCGTFEINRAFARVDNAKGCNSLRSLCTYVRIRSELSRSIASASHRAEDF
ncbi:MAG: hypothetical protein ACRD7E_28615 [Bryobacteraceae bacterium]